MAENDAISRIRGIEMPDYYLNYYCLSLSLHLEIVVDQ